MKVKRFLFVFIVLALVFAASQPVLSAQAQQGLAPLVGADAARAIAGRYIVVFHDDVPQEVVDRVLSPRCQRAGCGCALCLSGSAAGLRR